MRASSAWTNLRYTSLASSVILSLIMPVFAFFVVLSRPGWGVVELLVALVYSAAHVALFPLARELYFRLTAPIKRGLGQWYFGFPLVIGYLMARALIFEVLCIIAIPLGLIGLAYLSSRVSHGREISNDIARY